MKLRFAALAVMSLAVLQASAAAAGGNNGVAAVVNGHKINVADIKSAYEHNPAVKEKASFEDFYNRTLDIFVDGEIVYQAAMNDNVTETPEYATQLKALKEELARKIYLEKRVRGEVNDATVKKLYEDYKNSFKGEKEVKAKHILVDSENKAKEVIARLSQDGNFDQLAKQYSKEPADLGYFTRDVMVPEFSEAAFALKKGQYTKAPVQTKFGWHVILVEDIRDAKPRKLKEIEPQLKAMLAQKTMGDIVKGLQNTADVVKYDINGKVVK